MCGIAAFSKPEGSTTNSRLLAHHLLTQIESRGSHASGFAYSNPDGSTGIYKNPTPGSQLSLHELPRDARNVIIHTRYATQGDPKDNRNNHPVLSTDNRIAVVHNGVISNDYNLRDELGIGAQHGEVDSLVIPSLIAQHGVAGLSKLSGYAAIAWIDTQAAGVLNIAKLKNSPVAYTSLYDGTFVMASTDMLLKKALAGAGLSYGGVFELGETKMLTVVDGFIMAHDRAPSMTYDYGSYRRHSTATSGGAKATGTATSAATGRPAPTASYPKGSEDLNRPKVYIPGQDEPVDQDGVLSDLEEWRRKRDLEDQRIAMAMVTSDTGKTKGMGWTDSEWEEYTRQLEELDAQDHMSCSIGDAGSMDGKDSEYGEGFYVLDAEGDITHHPSLENLETKLKWLSEMSRTEYDIFPTVDDNVNWVNHIMDLGHVEEDGELVSWIDDTASVDDFESPAVRNLQYIREGAGHLATLRGA